MRRLLSTLLILAVVLLPGAPASARPALLDPRFGGDGIVTAFPNGGVATAVGIDAEGRIRHKHVGPIQARDLERSLLPILAELQQ